MINLLFYYDLFSLAKKVTVYKLIEEDNRILYNTDLSTLIERKLMANPESINLYREIIKRLHDSKKLDPLNTVIDLNNDILEEFTKVYLNCPENVVIAVSNSELANSKIPNEKHLVITASAKPNKNWLLLNLVLKIPILLFYFDFVRNSEIKDVLNSIYRLPKKINEAIVFDSQCKIYQHELFEHFKVNKVPVRYYTRELRNDLYKNREINDAKKKRVKEFFKGCKYFVSQELNITHARRLMFEYFVITFDHDFPQIDVNPDWHFTIIHDEHTYNNISQMCLKFNQK